MDEKLVSIIKKIQSTGGAPCKKKVQKIIYLIEEAGEDLGYEYSIHFYGPYSSDLDYAIQNLYNHEELNINITQYGHYISVDDSKSTIELSDLVNRIVDAFGQKDPSDLELITTTRYVQDRIDSTNNSDIIEGVKKIKGSKYDNIQIIDAIKMLSKAGFVNKNNKYDEKDNS